MEALEQGGTAAAACGDTLSAGAWSWGPHHDVPSGAVADGRSASVPSWRWGAKAVQSPGGAGSWAPAGKFTPGAAPLKVQEGLGAPTGRGRGEPVGAG